MLRLRVHLNGEEYKRRDENEDNERVHLSPG